MSSESANDFAADAQRQIHEYRAVLADYPYVVDYYLHGGQQRIRDAVAEVAKLLQVDSSLPALSSEW